MDGVVADGSVVHDAVTKLFHLVGPPQNAVPERKCLGLSGLTTPSEQTRAIDLGGDAEERLFIGGEELEMPSPRPLVEFDDPVRGFRRLVLFHRGGFSL